jgi:hypothetical protein
MSPIPEVLPPGKHYYAVTPDPSDPKRKYLHSLEPPKQEWLDAKVNIAPLKSLAKPFTDLQLVRSFVTFLNRLPDGRQFCVSME